jgi:hypothetical protein
VIRPSPLRTLPLLLALIAASCVSSRSLRFTSDDTLLGRQELEGGGSVTWRLHSSDRGQPTLERTERRTRQIAFLGVTSRNLTQTRAEELGLPSWRGLLLERVERDSGAERAGLRAGDVLLSIDGRELSSAEQLTAVVESDLVAGATVEVRFLRRGDDPQTPARTATLELGTREVTDTATDSEPLETSRVTRELTGLQVAELSAEQAQAVHGTPSPVLWVAAVVPGSPAYMAGVRAGDRLVTIDGAPASGLAVLQAAVLGRADERKLSIASPERDLDGPGRTAEGPVRVEVRGPLGHHAAEFDLRTDLGEHGEVDIPILFECSGDVDTLRWSFLDFIFQFGANYRRSYLASESRAPARYTDFSMLPFGFYEVEKQPGHARYRILWFIEWERSR